MVKSHLLIPILLFGLVQSSLQAAPFANRTTTDNEFRVITQKTLCDYSSDHPERKCNEQCQKAYPDEKYTGCCFPIDNPPAPAPARRPTCEAPKSNNCCVPKTESSHNVQGSRGCCNPAKSPCCDCCDVPGPDPAECLCCPANRSGGGGDVCSSAECATCKSISETRIYTYSPSNSGPGRASCDPPKK